MYASLTPSLFIEVPELSQEGSFICVLGISNLLENRNILLWFNEKIYVTLSEQFQQSVEKS
jgi:hypothetical protein